MCVTKKERKKQKKNPLGIRLITSEPETEAAFLLTSLKKKKKRELKKGLQWRLLGATLTLSVPGRHGNDPVDSCLSHGADHRIHGQGVSRHAREDRGGEAKTGHDHILPFKMSLQTACRENICFHHLEAADQETALNMTTVSSAAWLWHFVCMLKLSINYPHESCFHQLQKESVVHLKWCSLKLLSVYRALLLTFALANISEVEIILA